MKAALLISLLFYAGADDIEETNIPEVPNLDVHRLAGTWYPTAFVHKNKEPEDVIRFANQLEVTGEGDVILRMKYIKDETCQSININVVHTDKPGVFQIPATGASLYVVDTDYYTYHTVYIARHDSYSMFLSSRARGVSQFRKLAKSLGFDESQIVYDQLADSCE
ncbi:epididymal secretory protein 4-like [Heteronotia binoei]|uniref:epididymal secretory protein 4-like n=1 Tax=Heteronotia binoei TaxID=13085 RepID=UPI002931038F|nr:epididymal secretory protein 4-like [Heteronotia binoei]